MAKKKAAAVQEPSPRTGETSTKTTDTTSGALAELLGEVSRLLNDYQAATAISLLARTDLKSPWVTNARGVCELRLGYPAQAVETLRGLVLGSVGAALRDDVPLVFKTNYAAAQLANGNVTMCLDALAQIRDESNPAVQKLRAAIRQWSAGLTFWQKINWWLGGQPDRPVVLNFPVGDLE